MSDLKAYTVGQVVELKDGRLATIRFTGQTSFAAGDWIGVELDDATGKNDGSVQGQRFFDCKPAHGMFLRTTGISKIVEQSSARKRSQTVAKPATSPSTTRTRPAATGRPSISNGVAKPGGVDPTAKRRETLNAASPTPVRTAPSHTRTPSKLAPRAPTTGAAAARTPAVPATPRATATSRTAATPSAARTTATATRSTATSSRTSLGAGSRPSAAATKAAAPTPRTAAPRQSLVARAGAFPTKQPAATAHVSQSSITSRTSSSGGPSPRKTAPAATAPAARRSSIVPTKKEAQRSGSSSDLEEDPPEPDDDDEPEDDAFSDQDGGTRSSSQTYINGTDPAQDEDVAPRARDGTRSVSETMKASISSGSARPAATARQIVDLETKISLLEKSRNEDREQIKTLEKLRDKLQTERDRYESVIQKLQVKYQPQQQEINDLRKQLQDKEQQLTEVEESHGGHDEDFEMALLDKEMAEEVAENLKMELDQLKQKLEELQLEVEVLREENEELNKDVSPEERKQTSWLHLERENDRLREAIIRLRDMSMDTEAELRESITAQEEELHELRQLRDKLEETRERQKQTDTIVEDLRQQLEAALGADDMVEELTEKNMALVEQIEDLKIKVKDLEDLRELNEELELNHDEAEKQMLDEIDYKNSILAEQQRRAIDQEQKIVEREYAIAKFRELVTNLQSDIEEMRSSQQITETEAEELSSRSRAMADLNLKLQSSAARAQSNTLDLELRRLEAQEAVEHLSVVQMFLPDSYQLERDSVLTYLRFKRVAAKARLLHSAIRDKITRAPATATGADNVFVYCDVLDKLVWIASMCDRFSNDVSGSSLDRFARYESALYELDPVERGLNVYIEALKRGDLKEEQTAEELQRSISLLTHLGEVHVPDDSLEAYADDILLRISLVQSYLDNTALTLSSARSLIPSLEVEQDDSADEEDSLDVFKGQLDAVIGQSRSAKVVAGKTMTALVELKDRSMGLEQVRSDEAFEQCRSSCEGIAAMSRRLGSAFRDALNNDSDVEISPRSAIRSAISQFASTVGETSTPMPAFGSKLQIAATQLNNILALASDLSVAVEFERSPPPWIQKAEQAKSSKALSVSAEEEIQRLRDTIHERATQLRLRDQTLEEQSVKIELLESRTRDVNVKTNRITELQRLIEEGKGREKELEVAIDKKFHEIDTLMRDRDRWRQEAHNRKPSIEDNHASQGDKAGAERAVATAREMDALRAEIEGLQGAVRYLRDDQIRAHHDDTDLGWLREPIQRPKPKGEAERRRQDLSKEGNNLCSLFLDAMANARLVDLTSLPANKLGWRPAKQKPVWKVARQTEAWEQWIAKSHAFISIVHDDLGLDSKLKEGELWEDAREVHSF